MITLDTKVSQLNRVGQVAASKLKKLEIETVRDLIFYYPFRYDDFSRVELIDKLESGQTTTIRGKIELLASRRSPRKRKMLTEGLISDQSGQIKVIWFNQPWITKNLKIGDEVYLSGKVSGDLFNIYFNSPIYEKVSASNIHTARLVPIYSLTEGLSQKQIRFLIKSVLNLSEKLDDFLPKDILASENLINLPQALQLVHFPENKNDLQRARSRLAFDELFLIQLWSQIIKKKLKQRKSYLIKFNEDKIKSFVNGLDFKLTADQKKAAWEIIKDLENNSPMNRLIEGDVGSGKTVVAAIAIYNIYLSKAQSAMMAPTEILAHQHFETLYYFFKKYDLKVALLTRSQRIINGEKFSKKDFLNQCEQGEINVIVGTHALIQKEVNFKKLALVIIDEQHRFGVEQRQILKEKNSILPHFLSLTATPIPRSLALTLYGDLDLSIIKEMPKGRKKIITKVIAPEKRQLAYNFIFKQIKSGRQIFVVCPLIDPSDKLGVRSVTQEFEKLDQEIFPDLKIGLLHGRLKSADKEKVISDFADNKTNILVSTSVVEVGVDIPNATVMMIEGSERFGLASLHQFRGRVGRSHQQSYCFLFSDSSNLDALNRLKVLVNCHDGFELAQKDLEIRGSGQIYGYQQSGFMNLKIASLNDLALAKKAKVAAQSFISKNNIDDFPLLKDKFDSLGFSEHLE